MDSLYRKTENKSKWISTTKINNPRRTSKSQTISIIKKNQITLIESPTSNELPKPPKIKTIITQIIWLTAPQKNTKQILKTIPNSNNLQTNQNNNINNRQINPP
jgi:hypothetical protein